MHKISTGSELLDGLLNGGYESDIINTIYGPSGSGKTLLCLLAAIEQLKKGRKVIYIDTEGGFSAERFKQLWSDGNLDGILFLRPTSFAEQHEALDKLRNMINRKIGLVIVDTISMLYRLELGKEAPLDVNRELGKQLAFLNEIARKKDIPVLIANQIYTSFDERDRVNIVGGDLLKYSSKCMIELVRLGGRKRKAILRKHRSIADEKEVVFEIDKDGIKEAKERRGFKLF